VKTVTSLSPSSNLTYSRYLEYIPTAEATIFEGSFSALNSRSAKETKHGLR
jgi:hypothetical protein